VPAQRQVLFTPAVVAPMRADKLCDGFHARGRRAARSPPTGQPSRQARPLDSTMSSIATTFAGRHRRHPVVPDTITISVESQRPAPIRPSRSRPKSAVSLSRMPSRTAADDGPPRWPASSVFCR
jgi:hypothetical protein